jgi:hypothetical protein
VARAVVSTVDSVQLIQDDWDVLTAHFGEGKLLLRSLRITGAKPRAYVLVVIADSTLNVAFLGVALRVAASKLLTELEAGPPAPASAASLVPPIAASQPSAAVPVPPPPPPPAPSATRSEVARTGLSWSAASTGSMAGSGVGSYSGIAVSDSASSTFLTGCAKALGVSVGPMAKVFVIEAVRQVCGERAFTRADGPALIAHLSATIEDRDDRTRFQRAARAL